MFKMDAQAVESAEADQSAPAAGAGPGPGSPCEPTSRASNLAAHSRKMAPEKSHARRLGGSYGQQACRRRGNFMGRPLLGLVHMVVVVVLLGRLGSPERPGVVAAPASALVNAAAEAAAVDLDTPIRRR